MIQNDVCPCFAVCLQLNQIENDLQYLNKDTAGHLFVLEVIKESVNHTEAVRLVMPIKEFLRSMSYSQ